MKIVEWRCILPMTVEQENGSERYANAHRTMDDTDEKGGIQREIFEQRQYHEKDALYTKLRYRYKKKIPTLLKWFLPSYITEVIEETYNQFPLKTSLYSINNKPEILKFSVTQIVSEFIGEDQVYDDDTYYTPEELKQRQIYYLDVLNYDSAKAKEFNIHNFECPEINLQKLPGPAKCDKNKVPEWTKKYKGPMCMVRKIIRIQISLFGISRIGEDLISGTFLPGLYSDMHKGQIFWAKEWAKLSLDDITKYEGEIYAKILDILTKNGCLE